MANQRPFRFGVMAHPATALHAWQEQARRIEALGFDTLLISDHFDAQLAPLPALVAAATATTTLRVGTQVLANDFRHPALLAREAATVDVLSGGRLELGIGAGWNAAEYQQAGISFAHGLTRVARLRESVQILKRLWTGGSVSYAGEHYQLDALTSHPPPAQHPHPPLMIGGARRQLLSLAAEEADIVAFATKVYPDGRHDFIESTSPRMAERVRWVREAAGERFALLDLHVHVGGVILTDTPDATAAQLGPTVGLSGPQLRDCVQALLGSVDAIVEILQQRREQYGLNYFTIDAGFLEPMGPIVARLAGM
jgi:probable F420-dependent oxidoreductase